MHKKTIFMSSSARAKKRSRLNSCSFHKGTNTGSASLKRHASSYSLKMGAGIITLSPFSRSACAQSRISSTDPFPGTIASEDTLRYAPTASRNLLRLCSGNQYAGLRGLLDRRFDPRVKVWVEISTKVERTRHRL